LETSTNFCGYQKSFPFRDDFDKGWVEMIAEVLTKAGTSFDGGQATITADTARGESFFEMEVVDSGVWGTAVPQGSLSLWTATGATDAADKATTLLDALVEPMIKLLPIARPLAPLMTTVPDCTASPLKVLAPSRMSFPLPVIVKLPLPSIGPIMESEVDAAALKIVLLARWTGALITGAPARTETVAPPLPCSVRLPPEPCVIP
jgi:hypothetical protein